MKACSHAVLYVSVSVCGMLARVYECLHVSGKICVGGACMLLCMYQHVHMNAEAGGQQKCFPHCSLLYWDTFYPEMQSLLIV